MGRDFGQARRVAIIGAGMTGASLAALLGRAGFDVTLYDEHAAPAEGASRWNEGRAHLGYVYGADSSLRTARRLIPGAMRFRPVMETILEEDIRPHCTRGKDTFLVHRRSVIGPEGLKRNLEAVNALVRSHPDARDYMAGGADEAVETLSAAELRAVANPGEIVAGFRVPEQSVETQWLCDRLRRVVLGTPGVAFRGGARVAEARPVDTPNGRWTVTLADGAREVFDAVVNCAWQGLPALDRRAGLEMNFRWSHRYRLSVFARTRAPVEIDNLFVTVGPFGIVKGHHGRLFYLSWYDSGLQSYSEDLRPPPPAPLTAETEADCIARTREALERLLPPSRRIFEAAETLTVRGGYVYAEGFGDIGDPASDLHHRYRFGIRRRGGFISVNTGKFAMAPYLAEQVARDVFGVEARKLRPTAA